MLDHLGHVARKARETGGLRQIDIATEAGVSHVTISRFERAQSWPEDVDGLLAAYATELDIDVRSLWRDALKRWS